MTVHRESWCLKLLLFFPFSLLHFYKLRNFKILKCTYFKCSLVWVLIIDVHTKVIPPKNKIRNTSVTPEIFLLPLSRQTPLDWFLSPLVLFACPWSKTPYALFCIWFFSSVLCFCFIHAVADTAKSSLFTAEEYFIVWMCYNLLIHFPEYRYLTCRFSPIILT